LTELRKILRVAGYRRPECGVYSDVARSAVRQAALDIATVAAQRSLTKSMPSGEPPS
jgi:hypothetical protein